MNDPEAAPTPDLDPDETREWLESLEAVLTADGTDRAHFLLERMIDLARRSGAYLPYSANTAYINTLPAAKEARTPGDADLEWRVRSINRWNAMAMVVRANRESPGIGGHIASYASAATLYEVGYNHFFKGPTHPDGSDLVFFQGHSAPGVYARAYLLGLFDEDQLDRFRRETGGGGLSSYPHPWLMPEFWQFPTVSMGLGPIMAIYQARFMRYLEHRGLSKPGKRKVWAFMGDGEMDEPESLGAIGLAARERLDNLIFVVNCNLQRLDGPVRGNGKIVQELEAEFRGAGWNVIKVIWGSYWDPLLARDTSGLLRQRMEEAVDGEYQAYKAFDGKYVREHFFGKYPELKEMVASLSDEDIYRLNRGGHDPHKVYAAYAEAVAHEGQPTVILAKTVKGYGMGEAGEGKNPTHQTKKLGEQALKHFRRRFNIPIDEDAVAEAPYYRPPPDSPEVRYARERSEAMGGFVPTRARRGDELEVPELDLFSALLESSGEREFSTTMAFVRALGALVRDETIGERIVPIVPDEARTFGMEGMFRQLGIYSSVGQLYTPVDADQLMFYKESHNGQILEEGITEAGAFSSFIAAATAYSTHGMQMIPFYIFYSMFGFQRIGDLAWAAGDMRCRGFLLGGTAGRTTLAGEGLQHQDGHSHVLASNVPNCISYDPTFAYELAVIIHAGLKRMVERQEDVYYYLTVMNENYPHPAMPEGAAEGIVRGMYLFRAPDATPVVQLLGSGTILREVIAAAELLQNDFDIAANVWSATSFTELKRDGDAVERWNLLHPESTPRTPYVTECLNHFPGTPVVAATDYVKLYADQIRGYVPGRYLVLGTDGFGRSDDRAALRRHFEVDRYHVVVAALSALAAEGTVDAARVTAAMSRYGIDPERPDPRLL